MGGAPVVKKPTAYAPKFEVLSQQAVKFLKRNRFSQWFITGVVMMLREAGSVHRNTKIPQPKQTPQEFMWSPMKPGKETLAGYD